MKKTFIKAIGLILCVALLVSQAAFLVSPSVGAIGYPEYESSAVPEGEVEPVLLNEIIWLDASDTSNWNTGWHSQTTEKGYEDGHYYVQVNKTSTESNQLTISSSGADTIDISDMQYLEFDYWIPENYMVNANNWGCIEINSLTEGFDDAEMNISTQKLKKLNLKTGWNHLKLDLDDFDYSGENVIDKTAVTTFRFFVFSGEATDIYSVKFGDIKFTKYNSKDLYDPMVSTLVTSGTNAVSGDEVTMTMAEPPTTITFNSKITDSSYYKDMSGMDYLEFDLYLSDADIFNSATTLSFELRSNGATTDTYEINWTDETKNMRLIQGWNHIKLDISGASPSEDNVFDITQVSWLRIYFLYNTALSGERVIKLKNICFSSDVKDPTLTGEIMFNECGKAGANIAGEHQYAFHHSKQDTTYSTAITMSKKSDTAVDIRGYQFVEFDLWIEDSNAIFAGSDAGFEISSSGTCDKNELQATKEFLSSLGMQNGWNHVKISLKDMTKITGSIDLSAVNYFRLFTVGYTKGRMIDNIRFTRYDYQDKTNKTSILIDKGDSLDVNNSYGGSIALDETEDETALVLTCTGGTTGMLYNKAASYKYRYDFTDVEYIEFDLYTEDTQIFKDSSDCRIDLPSGPRFNYDGTAVHVTRETLKAIELDYGWNHIKVPVDYTTASDDFDIKDVRGFRFYFTNGLEAGESVKVKNFYATGSEGSDYPFLADKPETVNYTTEYVIADGDSIFDLSFNGTKQTVANTADNGEHFMQTTVPGSFSEGTYTITDTPNITTDVTDKDELVLSMLFYIDDVNALKKYGSCQIELSSDPASIDNNDVCWGMRKLSLKSGWNRLNLSFADADTSNGTFDPSTIALFRVHLSCYTDTVIAFDDIKITTLSEVGEDNLTTVSVVPEGYFINDVETPEYDYTFVAVPDLQEITALHSNTLTGMFNYIADNAEAMNTQFVMGLGDLTWSNTVTEYERVRAAYGILDNAGIQYSNVYGNHDFAESAHDTTNFNSYFTYDYYSNNFTTFGGAYQEGSMDNTYYFMNVEGMKYLVLALEYISAGTDKEGLMTWANNVVSEHSDYNVIVTTHAYLEADGTYIEGKGDYLWENLVSKHSNIFMVLCGHVTKDDDEGSTANRVSVGDNGNTVYEYMFNSQDVDQYYDGLGMLMFMHFSNEGKTITFRYYSPRYDAYYKEVNQFSVTLDVSSYIAPIEGDVNGDDKVDIRDLVRIKKYTVGNDVDVYEYCTNVEKDKLINASDITKIRKILIKAY